jgi:putative membrane protein
MRRRISRFMKIITALTAVLLILLPAGTAYSAGTPTTKEEDVYGLLDPSGKVNNIYVVNILDGGEITDYGSYSEVRNMTSLEQVGLSDDRITINTTAKKMYYQGTLESKELPWNIAISYFLDGKELTGPELAGKSGALKIRVLVTQNTSVNRVFYDNFALQIGLTLDTKLCDNIVAEGATIADAGRKKQLNFTVLPGEGTDIAVTTEVHDFDMDPITINGIRLNLGLNFDDAELTGQITELTDAIKGLDDGAGELKEGVTLLADGMQSYVDGLKAFKDGVQKLSDGTEELDDGASALSNGLSALSGQNDSLVNGALKIQQSAFDAVNAQLAGMNLGLPELTPKNYTKVLAGIPNLATVKTQLDGAVQFTQGLISYTDAVAQLGEGASALADGTSKLSSSTATLADSAKELYDAGAELNSAVGKLRDGLTAYKDGTGKMNQGTSEFGTQMEDKINGILNRISGNGAEVVSFVSDKNINVSAVQFVMKTEVIKLPVTEEATPKPKKLNFWQKLLRLFGLY